MPTIVNVKNVQKTYEGGFNALKNARTHKTLKNMGSQSFSNFSQKGVAGSGE
jgi:hypothetical protein